MVRRILSAFVLLGIAEQSYSQEQTAPPTLMPAFTGPKTGSATPPAAGAGRNVTLTPVFEMPKLNQPRPQPGMELKPEHGEWLIEIKSYAQVESGIMAQALANEIKTMYKVPVYLYEWGAEARKKRDEEEALSRKRIEEQIRPFMEFQEKLKAEAEARGEKFEETPLRTKVPVYYREMPDQYMVVLGGYKDIETARKALDIVRKWPAPKDTRLLDSVETSVVRDGKKMFETTFVNPFAEARVVRNMTMPKQQVNTVDEFLIRLNEGEPMSIMKSSKKWTLMVKSFNVPVSKAGQDTKETSSFRGPTSGLGGNKAGKWLDATAQQAEQFCKALRSMKDKDGRYVGFDAFILHHRNGSIVTVGEYNSPEEEKMQEDMRRIQALSFNKNENKNNQMGSLIAGKQNLFDGAIPIQIPK